MRLFTLWPLSATDTIVVIHSVGPVIVSAWKDNPNVTAILWAGLPGEQSGNAIVDILYGRINPGGKLPFTMGNNREAYGTDILYQPNRDKDPPQQTFTEGVFIDYRNFDQKNITPTYEFGFGLSYTTFECSNLVAISHNITPRSPSNHYTAPAPSLGQSSGDPALYQFPTNFSAIPLYIYPYLNPTDLATASGDADYGSNVSLPANATSSSPQLIPPAGGAPGGDSRLFDVLVTVQATITNTGSIFGEEVARLYILTRWPTQPAAGAERV